MGWAFGCAIVASPKLGFDDVRRDLWLAKKPDATVSMESALGTEYSDTHYALMGVKDRVLILGWPVLDVQDDLWEQLSRDGGRVVVLSLAENWPGNSYSIYENGSWRRRWMQPDEEGEEQAFDGAPHALEPEFGDDPDPSGISSQIYENIMGIDPFSHLLDQEYETDVPVWCVKSKPDE